MPLDSFVRLTHRFGDAHIWRGETAVKPSYAILFVDVFYALPDCQFATTSTTTRQDGLETPPRISRKDTARQTTDTSVMSQRYVNLS